MDGCIKLINIPSDIHSKAQLGIANLCMVLQIRNSLEYD